MQVKWDIIRMRRSKLLEKHQIVLDRVTRVKYWLHMLVARSTINQFKKKVIHGILKSIKRLKINFLLTFLKYKLITQAKRRRKTFALRISQMLKMIINLKVVTINDSQIEDAKKKLKHFLFQRSMNYMCTSQVAKFYKEIKFLQSGMKEKFCAFKNRK